MDALTPGLALTMTFLSTLLAAGCAIACSRLATKCSRASKRLPASEQEIQDLKLSLANLSDAHKRLVSRISMREIRENRGTGTTPQRETKAEARRRLGLSGVSGPEFAKRQLEMNTRADHHDQPGAA